VASTYSNLKIQLMATGENSGTWGNVTNANLGDAIEQALVETATVTFASNNVTLTLSDSNSRQNARALRLNLTGTTAGARDLIVPAIQKPYLVNNGTADIITVKVSGQTGVAVPASTSMLLYNNGTDVIVAFNRFVGNVVGNVTGNVTGTASNATVLQTARNIQTVSFNGSADITVVTAGTGITVSGTQVSIPQAVATNSNVQFGSFGVGTAASGTTGEIRATNNVTAFFSSDRKFKENIREIDGALEKITAIGGKYFDWTDEYVKEHGGEDGYFVTKSDFGVIAQDVQEVFSVAVKTREDGSLAVDYEKLCALAFAAIKELSIRVKELEGK
jgi:hypothetical protein